MSETQRRWNEATEYVQSLREEKAQLKQQLAAKTLALEVAREALQRLWDEDEMGWITDGRENECVKCGAKTKALSGTPIVHNDGCVQGYIGDALSTIQSPDELLNEIVGIIKDYIGTTEFMLSKSTGAPTQMIINANNNLVIAKQLAEKLTHNDKE